MKKYLADVIVMRLKFVNASSRLKTENVDIIILSSKSKALLSRKLTSHRNTTLTDKEWFLTLTSILNSIEFIHLNEAIITSSNKFQDIRRLLFIYKYNKSYFFFRYEFLESLTLVDVL